MDAADMAAFPIQSAATGANVYGFIEVPDAGRQFAAQL